MKIVQLVQTLDIGGLERLAVDLAVHQKLEGHKTAVYCTIHAGALADVALAAGVPVHVFRKTDGFSARLISRLVRQLRKDRPDVLHAHNALVLHYAVVAAWLARVPVVINTQHSSNLVADVRLARLWARMVRYTDAVVFVSEDSCNRFVAQGMLSRTRSRVIYNGINLEMFLRPVSHAERSGRFRFGTVGRLQPVKDHITMIRAFARVRDSLPGAELHILGDGPCRREIEATAAALGVSGQVVLHGARLEVADFLSELDVFVLSSRDEGLPIALMEAMAAGLPVVSTRLPSLQEIAQEGTVAWYSRPGDPEELGMLMLKTAQLRDLADRGAAARRSAQRFSIEETWRQYSSLFEELLSSKQNSLKWRPISA